MHCRSVAIFLAVFLVQFCGISAPRIVTPKVGVKIPASVRNELSVALMEAEAGSVELRGVLKKSYPTLLRLMPDVDVFQVAVKRTLEDEIFYRDKDFGIAKKLLAMGAERRKQLLAGKTPWLTQTGLVVRGYVSRIDGSLQPYGLWVSPEYKRDGNRRRLDIWYHGRNDKLSEVSFLDRRLNRPAPFTPKNGIVLYPYGRFCNAMKFAGETDTWEALEHLKQNYAIDENRISARGFSMGGAASWHMGAHHSSEFVAVNPGAGFAETKIYQGLTDKLGEFPWYEKRLWRLYDALDYAVNLENTSLVAYSGEIDKQKQAADLMEAALLKEGIAMTHIIGPKTGHKYEPGARDAVAKLVTAAVAKGRNLIPSKVRFVTYTLKYNRMHWVTIEALDEHWEEARVEAELTASGITASTRNVSAITFAPQNLRASRPQVVLDGQTLPAPWGYNPLAGWSVRYRKIAGKWTEAEPVAGLRKQPGVQGPIDDAFMDAFVMVPPDGKGWHPRTDEWVRQELADANFQWRRQMRGKARVKTVAEISADDIANSHLVLWGDPASNSLIDRLLPLLPIEWTRDIVGFPRRGLSGKDAVLVMVYPNPLNPEKYVVFNSGMTYAHFGAMSNSRQTPKLPDWALLDVQVGAPQRIQGKGVLAAGFFDEFWQP